MVFQLDRHLAAINTEIRKRVAEDEGLARRTEILTSISDVSRVTAAGLLTQMPELGRLDAKAVASLADLASVTRQSGAWQGRSFIQFIQDGRARARRLLYMPALAATRYNPDLCAKYRQLVAEDSRGRSRWSPSCASSSCWSRHGSTRTAAGFLNGPGGS